MDKNEKKAMSILNGIFADDENMENDSSDSDYEPNEKKSKTSIKNSGEKVIFSPELSHFNITA